MSSTFDQIRAPDYTEIGAPLVSKVRTSALDRPVVAWLNVRWLLSNGIDARDPVIRRNVSTELLTRFAVSSSETLIGFEKRERVEELWADRYGEFAGTPRGGSGRCASFGKLNAKGIGPTPLVGRDDDWTHSHGHLWLEEAAQEVAFSEIVDGQFPYGAVPVVALIVSGARALNKEESQPAPTAIVVRPNFLRLAHLQRSLYFGSAGDDAADQYLDAQRIDLVFRYLTDLQQKDPSANRDFGEFLYRSFCANVRQTVFGWVNRLWLGPAFSGNRTIDGQSVDFFPCDFMPGWTRTATGRGDPPFGDEKYALTAGYLSILQNLEARGLYTNRRLRERFDFSAAFEKAWGDCVREAVPLNIIGSIDKAKSDDLSRMLLECFVSQQERSPQPRSTAGKAENAAAADEIHDLAEAFQKDGFTRCTKTEMMFVKGRLQGLLARRGRVSRAKIVAEVTELASRHDPGSMEFGMLFGKAVARWLCQSRFSWPNKPPELLVKRFVSDGVAWLADCIDVQSGDNLVWIEASCLNGHATSMVGQIPLTAIENPLILRGCVFGILGGCVGDYKSFLFPELEDSFHFEEERPTLG